MLALVGLLWMHGLGTHGTGGTGGTGATDTSPAAAAHAVHQEPAADADPGGSGDHGAHVMAVGLCLALLLAAVLLPLRRSRGVLLRLRRSASRVPGLLPGVVPRARPPDLVALGICRC